MRTILVSLALLLIGQVHAKNTYYEPVGGFAPVGGFVYNSGTVIKYGLPASGYFNTGEWAPNPIQDVTGYYANESGGRTHNSLKKTINKGLEGIGRSYIDRARHSNAVADGISSAVNKASEATKKFVDGAREDTRRKELQERERRRRARTREDVIMGRSNPHRDDEEIILRGKEKRRGY